VKKKRIYLVSEMSGGAAWTDAEEAAEALESIGYRRCTRGEYRKRIRMIHEREDEADA
jgi:hypothetical protein